MNNLKDKELEEKLVDMIRIGLPNTVDSIRPLAKQIIALISSEREKAQIQILDKFKQWFLNEDETVGEIIEKLKKELT